MISIAELAKTVVLHDPNRAEVNALEALVSRAVALEDRLRALGSIINRMSEDDALWVMPEVASEAYMQNAMRVLHTAVKMSVEDMDLEK